MRGTIRKVKIAAADGELRLLPIAQHGQHARRTPAIRIGYGSDNAIAQLDQAKNKQDESAMSIEVHGIVGSFSNSQRLSYY